MNFSKYKINISERKKYYLTYSLCFMITSLLIFSWFLIAHRTFVWKEDGWTQHYRALIYYSKYLRSIIKGILLNHELVIPHWDFSFGQGSDILSTLNYYTIGDPLSIFSVFFSEENMYLYYDAAIILRIYFAGIVFSAFCFETGKKNYYGVLAGAMSYTFCEWALSLIRHPYFLNPMIYFPLLLLGIEKIIKKKRPYLFTITVAISALCNFYFFYMMVLAVIVYVIIRLFISYRKNIKDAALLIARLALSSILGVILSAVIFLPICYVFISNSRVSKLFNFRLFYPLAYYSKLPGWFIAPGSMDYTCCMGFAAPVLLAVFLMYYKRKEHTFPKVLFIACLIAISFPVFGSIFNGFSYLINRWLWAFALISSYILALMWSSLMSLTAKEGRFLFKCITVYSIVCLFLEYSRRANVFAQIVAALIFLFTVFPLSNTEISSANRKKQQLAILLVFITIIINGYWKYSPDEINYPGSYMEVRQLALDANETAAIAETAASEGIDEFYRYSGRSLTKNANMIAGISSTQYYWSLLNPVIDNYRSRLDLLENRSYDPSNYDDRAALNSLASVLYYSLPQNDSAPAPYGFTQVDAVQTSPSYKIYRNDYALPLAYTYDNYMKEETWDTLSSPAKEEAMLESVVLSEDAVYTPESEPTLSSYELPYTMECNSNEISLQGKSFVTTSEDASATLTFDAPPDSEIFLIISGLQFKESSRYDLHYGDPALDPLDIYDDTRWEMLDYMTQYSIKKAKFYWSDMEHRKTTITLKSSENESKSLEYYTKDHSNYIDKHNFATAFSAGENGLSSIELSFGLHGVYYIDSIKVICQPMDNYVNQIEALRENTLQNVNIGTDIITGNISLETPGLLCFTIPYSIGWSAYVDGQEAKLYQANIMHMALDLDAGAHEIRLVYKTPFLREGIYISIFGIAIFIVFILVNEKRIRKNNNKINKN